MTDELVEPAWEIRPLNNYWEIWKSGKEKENRLGSGWGREVANPEMAALELWEHNECLKHFQIYETLYFTTTAVF